MSGFATIRALRAGAGLLVGAGIWAINTQLGEILPYVDCVAPVSWSAIVSFISVAFVLCAAAISWRGANDSATADPTMRFVGSVSGLAALMFSFALAIQGAASLVLSGCER
jgi:hypothetical protein